jgi:Kef-type K+ transport system membrane component KefB
LKDAGESASEFGQLVLVAASIADFATVILLSLFFSREATSTMTQVLLLGGFVLLAVAIVFAVWRAERTMWFSPVLLRLQNTSAQILVRGAFALLAIFVALAERIGLEVILGAFIAGAMLKLVDRDEQQTHPDFRHKLEAIGFGVFIPFFFVATGLRFNLQALLASPQSLIQAPLFLVALLIVRGIPALLYRPRIGTRRSIAAGLMQATTLGFVVVSAQIGMELGHVSEATGAALIAAALLSVMIFPLSAGTLIQRRSLANVSANFATGLRRSG